VQQAPLRDHRSLLADAERRLLVRLARSLPDWVNSDHLTAFGLASMLAAAIGFAAIRLTPWSAIAVVCSLAANWFGDSLDGTLARVRSQQRPRYGFYIDHVIDIAGAAMLLVGIAASGAMHPVIALALLAAFLLVAAETYLATEALGVLHLSFAGFGPTELRIVLALGALRLMGGIWVSLPWFGMTRLFDVGGVVSAAGLLVVFVVSAARHTRALYIAEPIPERPPLARA